MEHQGERLRQLIKAKGFNMSELAGDFGVTRAAIEKHFRSERLTRKVVKRYSEKFGFSLESFFEEKGSSVNQVVDIPKPSKDGSTVSLELYAKLQEKYIEQQERYISLQSQYLELTKRFFPNAAQRIALG